MTAKGVLTGLVAIAGAALTTAVVWFVVWKFWSIVWAKAPWLIWFMVAASMIIITVKVAGAVVNKLRGQ